MYINFYILLLLLFFLLKDARPGFLSANTTTDNYLTLKADNDKITDNRKRNCNSFHARECKKHEQRYFIRCPVEL